MMILTEEIELVARVRAELHSAAAGYRFENYAAWRAKQDQAKAAAILHLTQCGAIVRDDWRGTRFKFLGITVTCTGGLHGALGNWLSRAEVERAK